MAINVKVPNPNFDGIRSGVKFERGVGVFEDETLGREVAVEFGYEIDEDVAPKADEDGEEEPKRGRRKKEEA